KPRSPGAFSFSESAPPAPLPLFRARLRAGSAAMPALRDRFAALAMSDFEKRARSRRYPDRTRVPWRPLRFDTRFRQFLRAPLSPARWLRPTSKAHRRDGPLSRPRRFDIGARGCRGSAAAEGDAALGEVVGSELNGDAVAREDADVVLAHLAGDMSRDHVPVVQFYAKQRVGEGLDDRSLHLDVLFFGQAAGTTRMLIGGV